MIFIRIQYTCLIPLNIKIHIVSAGRVWWNIHMKKVIVRNTRMKSVIALLVIIVFTATSLFISAESVSASDPQYVNWQQYPTNPVFDPAESAYYPSIIFDGTTYHMWYDDGTATRYTTSTDGISWLVGTPVTGLTNGRHAVVKWVGTEYRVWYWNSTQLYSINDIRTAKSPDGIAWTNDSVISQVGGATVIAGNPGVNWNAGSYGPCDVFYNPAGSGTIVAPVDAATVWQNKFVMYYDGTTGGLEDIGVAVSNDGIQWRGYNDGAAPVLAHGASGWDDGFATFCTVLKIDGTYHMWYSGGHASSHEGIGYAQSSDGLNWTKYASNPIMHRTDGITWRAERTYTPRVLYDAAGFSGAGESAQLKMWYNGVDVDPSGNYVLGYARITISAGPVSVGGRVNPVDKAAILAPYFGLLLLIAGIIVTSGLVLKKAIVRKNR
jgi:predicted GH43/DUF377 family glycosyl hydrolase